MPFVSIRLAGTASKQQKAEIVADVTLSLIHISEPTRPY